MSTSTENTKKEGKGLVMTLVSKIAAALKLGDEGKLQSFMDRIIRDSSREVTRLTQNLSTEKISYDHSLEKLNDDLADAKQALEDAYMNVNVTRIGTNADQDAYKATYLYGIEEAEKAIDRIEDKITRLKEGYSQSKKEITEQINAYKARIATFEGK
jgi:predicted  nucleic acid-binding Zn-ribbon protein